MEEFIDINKYIREEKFSEQDEIGEYSENYNFDENDKNKKI